MATQSESVTVTLAVRDARFAVAHLRYLADRETAHDAEHAAANLSARFVADRIEQALSGQNPMEED